MIQFSSCPLPSCFLLGIFLLLFLLFPEGGTVITNQEPDPRPEQPPESEPVGVLPQECGLGMKRRWLCTCSALRGSTCASLQSQHCPCYHGQRQVDKGVKDLGLTILDGQPANAGDAGSIPGSVRSPGGWNGNPYQYYCLENPMDRGAWWATVHEVAKESDMT